MTAWFSLHISVFGIPEFRFLSSGISRLPLVKIAISRVPVIITISNISSPFSFKIPNPDLEISQIPDPEKPIGDPRKLHNSRGKHTTWSSQQFNPTPLHSESVLCEGRVYSLEKLLAPCLWGGETRTFVFTNQRRIQSFSFKLDATFKRS